MVEQPTPKGPETVHFAPTFVIIIRLAETT
jgi:hypothetical protein